MKKVLILLVAALAALPAAAQHTEKLNFEAPLFGVTKKNVKPKWSVVVFGGVQAWYSYRFVEDPIRSSGLFGELDLIDFRLRPWRDGNTFSWGLSHSFDAQRLAKGTVFAQDGSFVGKPAGWLWARAHAAESVTSLNLGYVREFGEWKFGVFVSPGVGIGIRHNRYYLASPLRDKDGVIFDYTPVGGDWHTDNLYTDAGWRLGISAGIWHRFIGLTAGWNYRSVLPGHQNVIHAGLSIRY